MRPRRTASRAVDDGAGTEEDAAVVVVVTANDTDADGDVLPAALASGPSQGTASLTDGATSTATVTVAVAPVNDAPTAGDDGCSVAVGTQLSGDLLSNDGDEDGDPPVVDAHPGLLGHDRCDPTGRRRRAGHRCAVVSPGSSAPACGPAGRTPARCRTGAGQMPDR